MGNFDTIQNCEQHFCKWIKVRLHQHGIHTDYHQNLKELLHRHSEELDQMEQHIKPLKRWCQIKDECYGLAGDMDDVATFDEPQIKELMEKIAFEGQILLLTMQDS